MSEFELSSETDELVRECIQSNNTLSHRSSEDEVIRHIARSYLSDEGGDSSSSEELSGAINSEQRRLRERFKKERSRRPGR